MIIKKHYNAYNNVTNNIIMLLMDIAKKIVDKMNIKKKNYGIKMIKINNALNT